MTFIGTSFLILRFAAKKRDGFEAGAPALHSYRSSGHAIDWRDDFSRKYLSEAAHPTIASALPGIASRRKALITADLILTCEIANVLYNSS
jgi:hypothetical protein